MPEDASTKLETHAEDVPAVIEDTDGQDEDAARVLEKAGEIVDPEVQTADDPGVEVAAEVACEEDWLADKVLDEKGAEVDEGEETHAEPLDDEGELAVEACCDVAPLDDGTRELTLDVVIVAITEDREDPDDGTITTGGAPLDAS